MKKDKEMDFPIFKLFNSTFDFQSPHCAGPKPCVLFMDIVCV